MELLVRRLWCARLLAAAAILLLILAIAVRWYGPRVPDKIDNAQEGAWSSALNSCSCKARASGIFLLTSSYRLETWWPLRIGRVQSSLDNLLIDWYRPSRRGNTA